MTRTVRAALAAAAAAGLLAAADPPPDCNPPKDPYGWPQLPADEQVKRVFVKRVAPGPNEPASVNAEVRFELGAKARAVMPREPRLGAQLTPPAGAIVDAIPGRRMEVDFAALAADWKKYTDDARKAERVVQYAARTRESFALKPRDFGELTYGGGFPVGTDVEILPFFRGIPDVDPGGRKALIDRSLMIRHLAVVNHEWATGKGPWSFGHLLRQLASEPATGVRAEEFVRRWLRHWEEDQPVNGTTVPNRAVGIGRLIADWPKTPAGELDLDRAPFRLLAIVSRLDLRNNLVLGSERVGGGGAGEARFVFCALAADGKPQPFTVIFEYAVKKNDFPGVRQWAKRWFDLAGHDPNGQAYRDALRGLTDDFAGANADPESPPNRSGLAQLRTNEISLDLEDPSTGAVPLWELREFRLGDDGFLHQVTVKQNPDLKFNNTARLAQFANGNESVILGKAHRTPVQFPAGRPFLGGSAVTPVNHFWHVKPDPMAMKPGITSGDARHLFSLGTCNGCHAAEAFRKVGLPFTGDPLDKDQPPPMFTHVRPRTADRPSQLSAFLAGEGEGDFCLDDPDGQKGPDGKVFRRPFGDLRRRADDLYGLVQYGWFYEFHRLPMQFVH